MAPIACVNKLSTKLVIVNKKSLTNAYAKSVTTTSSIIINTYVIDFAIAGIDPSIANGSAVIDLTVRIILLINIANA